MKKHRGFTLVELLYTMAVVGIVLAVGVPSVKTTLQNSKMNAAINTAVAAVLSARSESIKQKSRVTICRSTLGDAPVCSTSGEGIIVFLNASDDKSYDSGSDTLVRLEPFLTTDSIAVKATGIDDYITFTPAGVTRAVGGGIITGNLLFCDDRGNDGARMMTLTAAGRPAVRPRSAVTGAASCP